MPRRATDRFTISSFPQQVQLDPNFAESTWTTLEHAITEINKRNTSNLSFEQLYRYSYNMVLHKHGDYLYSRLTRLQTDHLKSVAAQICHTDAPAFLPEIERQWSWFELSLAHVRDVLMYMDRHYVKSRGLKSVYQLGIELFRDVVISDAVIFPRLSHALLTAIDLERNGETVDTPLMKAITRMLAQLGPTPDSSSSHQQQQQHHHHHHHHHHQQQQQQQHHPKSIYESVFETVFLERTRQFYSREATLYLADSTCSEYLHKASRRLYEERIRVDAYLEPQTASKVRAVTERELITKYMTKLIDMDNSGLIFMLRNDKVHDLRLMYTLFRDIDSGEEMLRNHLKREVLERGSEIVNNPDLGRDPVALIVAVLQLKAKYERILNTAFTLPATGSQLDVLPATTAGGSAAASRFHGTPGGVGSQHHRQHQHQHHQHYHHHQFHPHHQTRGGGGGPAAASSTSSAMVDVFAQQQQHRQPPVVSPAVAAMGVGATSGVAGGVAGALSAGERTGPLLSSAAGNTMGSSSSGVGLPYGGPSSSSGAAASSSVHGGSGGQAAMLDANMNNNVVVMPPSSGIADKKFVATVNEAFERFINGFPEVSEYVSLYVDKLLRKDFKGSSDDEVEAILEAVMTLFRFLSEKDAFQRYYQQHLMKRLLYSRASSSDAERAFLAKMKMDCGYMYTQKMEVMFSDMKLSEDANVAFKECVNQQQQQQVNMDTSMHGIDLNVSVLTTMSWPVSSQQNGADVQLPTGVTKCMERYQEFYYGKHEGRRLTWQGDLGVADVRGRFGKDSSRVIDFVHVPAFCVCILMLFNDRDRDEWTYAEIAEATRIPDAELVRHLQSLAMAKYKVLKRKEASSASSSSSSGNNNNSSGAAEPTSGSGSASIKSNDLFVFNEDFVSRNRRVRLQVVSARKETENEKNQTKSKIDDDRRPVIDTVIVRIMKHRKTLEHNKLMVEVTNMLAQRFEPNPHEIKKRIESLVEREYLERQPDKRQIYQYVA